MSNPRLAVLISGHGSNLQALIDACANGQIAAEIALVISNKAEAYGLTRAKEAGLPTQVISHKDYPDRAAFDSALDAALRTANCEYVCLAGFMRLLTGPFVKGWAGRMVNIHPSLLPSYKGTDTHRRVLEDGVKITGCTVHFVVPEMDAGPIIVQKAVAVADDDTEDSLAQKVHIVEHQAYVEAVSLLVAGKLRIEDGKRVRVIT